MSRTKWAAALVLFTVAAFAAWYFYSPQYVLREMRAAARANDSERLSSYIDFPALRESMKSEIMARILVEAQKDKTGFGGLSLAIGSAMVGPMIDGIVSPAGLRAALISSNEHEGASPQELVTQPLTLQDQPVIERRGLSEFVVTSKRGNNGAMIFKRDGLGWKLSGIELPPDTDSTTTAPTRSTEQQTLFQLGALNLAIALKRAIHDAGYACKRITDAGFVGAWKNLDQWTAHCQNDGAPPRDWAIFAGPDGSAQVRDCRDNVASGLPACTITQRPSGSFF